MFLVPTREFQTQRLDVQFLSGRQLGQVVKRQIHLEKNTRNFSIHKSDFSKQEIVCTLKVYV